MYIHGTYITTPVLLESVQSHCILKIKNEMEPIEARANINLYLLHFRSTKQGF